MSRRLILIAAHARNRVIGQAGDMPWHLPDDLKHFMQATLGGVVVMGRKTFESLKGPLPRRRNIVITRNAEWQHEGVEQQASSLEEALDLAGEGSVHIAGGGEIYRAALPIATHLDLTEIDAAPDGDTFSRSSISPNGVRLLPSIIRRTTGMPTLLRSACTNGQRLQSRTETTARQRVPSDSRSPLTSGVIRSERQKSSGTGRSPN